MHKIARFEVLDSYRLDLVFDDGKRGVVDLSRLVGKGVFSIWADYGVFKGVRIGDCGELIWGDEVDLCPDSLYLEATHQEPEDIFPGLTPQHVHA